MNTKLVYEMWYRRIRAHDRLEHGKGLIDARIVDLPEPERNVAERARDSFQARWRNEQS